MCVYTHTHGVPFGKGGENFYVGKGTLRYGREGSFTVIVCFICSIYKSFIYIFYLYIYICCREGNTAADTAREGWGSSFALALLVRKCHLCYRAPRDGKFVCVCVCVCVCVFVYVCSMYMYV